MKKTIVFVLSLVFCQNISLAQGKISLIFGETIHNFGTLYEEDKTASVTFSFFNASNFPVSIKNVETPCGCIYSNYSKEPVPPYGIGTITIDVNLQNSPKELKKSVNVRFAANNDYRTQTLCVEGKVLPYLDSNDSISSISVGNILLSSNAVDFGSVFEKNIEKKWIEIYNNSDKSVSISFSKIPKYIKLFCNEDIEPYENDTILLMLDGRKLGNIGYVSENIQMKIDGKPSGIIALKADIKEDFSKISYFDKTEIPQLRITPRNISLANIKKGETKRTKIAVANIGGSVLEIRKLHSNSENIAVKAASNSIAAGNSVDIAIAIDSGKFSQGIHRQRLFVETNDPFQPIIAVIVDFRIIN